MKEDKLDIKSYRFSEKIIKKLAILKANEGITYNVLFKNLINYYEKRKR